MDKITNNISNNINKNVLKDNVSKGNANIESIGKILLLLNLDPRKRLLISMMLKWYLLI